MKSLRLLLGLSALFALTLAHALADDDPPGRVVRVQSLSGQVSLQPNGQGEWFEATVNRPLTSHDNIWADKDSRAELSLGSALLSIGAESSLTLDEVGDATLRAKINQGELAVHVRRLYPDDVFEIDTPTARLELRQAGDYRIDVDADGAATVIVWRGQARAFGVGASLELRHNEQALLDDKGSLRLSGEPTADDFDRWRRERDALLDHARSTANVSPDLIGAEDLDDHGSWLDAPEYGRVWAPSVDPGWAPYRYGHWVWIEPWGWTWVDDAPWGFAPFHYGRWVWWRDRWCWAPGPRVHRAFYAPAMVVWFGGPGWGVSAGVGVWGWAPLGWGEPFYPWRRGGPRYFERVNMRNTTIVNIHVYAERYRRRDFGREHWANVGRPGGLSAVASQQMGARVSDHLAHVDAKRLSAAPVTDRASFVRPSSVRERRATVAPRTFSQSALSAPRGAGARPADGAAADGRGGRRPSGQSPAAERMSRVPRPGANIAPAARDPQAGGRPNAEGRGSDTPRGARAGASQGRGGGEAGAQNRPARPGDANGRGGDGVASPRRTQPRGEDRSSRRTRTAPDSNRREAGEERRR